MTQTLFLDIKKAAHDRSHNILKKGRYVQCLAVVAFYWVSLTEIASEFGTSQMLGPIKGSS
jgi:hypothetical protein